MKALNVIIPIIPIMLIQLLMQTSPFKLAGWWWWWCSPVHYLGHGFVIAIN